MILTVKISTLCFIFLLIVASFATSIAIEKQENDQTDSVYSTDVNQKINDAIDMVNMSLVVGYLEDIVNIGPRMTSTYGCKKAAEYILEKFEDFGLDAEYHEWSILKKKKRQLPEYYKSNNVIGTLKGNNPEYEDVIVFNAHYDTVKVSPGANDDGSGTAAVLVAAHILSQFEFNRTIKFITFSGEELGLFGSEAYARELYKNDEKILVEFNADMIGYANTSEGGKKHRLYSTQDASWIIDEIEDVNEIYNINFNLNKGIVKDTFRGGSDFASFLRYGYETLAFFQSENNPDYWHTPEDTLEHINFSYLYNVTRLIIGTIAHIADVDIYYPHISITSPKRGKLYYEDRIIRNLKQEEIKIIDDVLVCTEVTPGDAPIDYVEFYYDGKLVCTDKEKPYQWRMNKRSFRRHNIEVVVVDEKERTASDYIEFLFLNLNTKVKNYN